MEWIKAPIATAISVNRGRDSPPTNRDWEWDPYRLGISIALAIRSLDLFAQLIPQSGVASADYMQAADGAMNGISMGSLWDFYRIRYSLI